MLSTDVLGLIATAIAVLGVLSRLVLKARPLYHLLPAAYRWVPDAVAAGTGALLLGLPSASTAVEVVEVVGAAVIAGALAAAPGAKAPEHPEADK